MKMQVEATGYGARVTGLTGLPGWAVEIRTSDGAVTLVPPAGEEVTAEAWRTVRLAAVLRAADSIRRGDALRALLQVFAGDDAAASSRGGKRAHLSRVTNVYRAALEHDLAPRDALAEVFDVSEPTAQRWIAQAREAGLIGDYRDELARAQTYAPQQPREARTDPAGTDRRTGRAPGPGSTADPQNGAPE